MTNHSKGSSSIGISGNSYSFLWKGWQWLAIIGLAVITVVLGYWGFWKYHFMRGASKSIWDILYLTLQLFIIESGPVPRPLPWQLEVARFLAPVVPAWTAVYALAMIFRDQLQALRLRFTCNHVVICGIGRKGAQLVRDFRQNGEKVVGIEIDNVNANIKNSRDLGALVLVGDATEKFILRRARVHRAKYVVAISGVDGTNVSIAMRTYQLKKEMDRKGDRTVTCFVQIADLKLSTLIKHLEIFRKTNGPFVARIFNPYRSSARALFQQHPLEGEYFPAKDPRTVQLVVVGFGKMGECVVLQAAQIGHYANRKRLQIVVIDHLAEEKEKLFNSRYPQFGQVCDISFLKGEADDPDVLARILKWAEDQETITTVAVCLDGDSSALSWALSIQLKLEQCERAAKRETPIFVRLSEEAGFEKLLDCEGDLQKLRAYIHPFGTTDHTCTRELLLHEKQDTLARTIQEVFRKDQEKRGRPLTDPSMQPWDQLIEDFKESNRHAADHISVKLRAIGCICSSVEEKIPAVAEFEKDEVEIMAIMEHARYCAERLLGGWKPGPIRNLGNKISPYLVPWEELSEEIKDYDREGVRGIPHVLEMVGERIYRRENVSKIRKRMSVLSG